MVTLRSPLEAVRYLRHKVAHELGVWLVLREQLPDVTADLALDVNREVARLRPIEEHLSDAIERALAGVVPPDP